MESLSTIATMGSDGDFSPGSAVFSQLLTAVGTQSHLSFTSAQRSEKSAPKQIVPFDHQASAVYGRPADSNKRSSQLTLALLQFYEGDRGEDLARRLRVDEPRPPAAKEDPSTASYVHSKPGHTRLRVAIFSTDRSGYGLSSLQKRENMTMLWQDECLYA